MSPLRAVVIGGTSGIGHAMACRLASTSPPSSSIIISGRTCPSPLPHPETISFLPLDATSMRSIKSYTTSLAQSHFASSKIDVLIMSQGIMSTAPRTETPEGIDRKMALHYYGKQLLIRELLPLLTPSARVVTVYDGWLGSPDKLLWDDLDLKRPGNYGLAKAADHCVSMTDGMVQWWATRGQAEVSVGGKRHFVHAYPGGVNTNLMREVLPGYLQGVVKAVGRVVLTSPETCAERLLEGVDVRSVEGEGEGRYWSNIDNKGRTVKGKAVWTEEQMERVSRHTWEMVDAALAVGE
ncbi:putative oxidoreductase YkvO [Podospora conica]|nr:putative oxidoreductase YkvO [Schizothecium conicum]